MDAARWTHRRGADQGRPGTTHPPLAKAIALGIDLHEGHFFGRINQIFNTLVATALVWLCVTGFIGWYQRRPAGRVARAAEARAALSARRHRHGRDAVHRHAAARLVGARRSRSIDRSRRPLPTAIRLTAISSEAHVMRFPRSARAQSRLQSARHCCIASGRQPAAQTADTLEEVVITAQRIREQIEAEQALTPGGVTVIDGDDLYERSVTNMTDMLRYVPGVWSESGWGSDELFFSSRGSNLDATDYDKNGIKLFQDGLPVTTADGNNHNRVLDPLSARYAVIARGANALTYGASTLGGAFDFISPTARTTDPLSVYLTGGSHGLLSGRVTAGGVADAFDGLVTLEAKNV